MDDRTLLEMAAKAAGIDRPKWDRDWWGSTNQQPLWNPLTDDGDAFRLAVKLRIDIDFDELNPLVEVYHKTPDKGAVFSVLEAMKPDNPCAAVRWAIVRAAAAIGAALP